MKTAARGRADNADNARLISGPEGGYPDVESSARMTFLIAAREVGK